MPITSLGVNEAHTLEQMIDRKLREVGVLGLNMEVKTDIVQNNVAVYRVNIWVGDRPNVMPMLAPHVQTPTPQIPPPPVTYTPRVPEDYLVRMCDANSIDRNGIGKLGERIVDWHDNRPKYPVIYTKGLRRWKATVAEAQRIFGRVT